VNDPPSARPLGRLLHYARDSRGRIRLACVYSVLNKVFDLAPPLLIGVAVDTVIDSEGSFLARQGFESAKSQLWALAGLTLAVWILESVFEYLQKITWRNLAQSLQHELRLDAYAHVQSLEMAFFEDARTGGLMSILNDDVNQLERFLDQGANALLQVTTTALVIGGIFFYFAPSVAWMAMLPMPFILWGSIVYQRLLAPRYARVRADAGLLNSELAGHLSGSATIKSFTAEEREIERIRERSEAYRTSNRAAIRLSSSFSPLIRMVIVLGFTATLVGGGLLAIRGELAPGAYAVMVFFTQRLLWPLTQLGETFDLYQRAMASTNRVLDLLDTQPTIVSGERRLPVADVRGEVRFEQVSFAYRDREPLFAGLDLELPAGRETAIVGPTGSGKSTLIKLLLRFYDVGAGVIRLDGIDVRELGLGDLRRCAGLVSQDVYLFHGTVRENVAYGRPDASDEEIAEAARVAEADEFIRALPEGYDTLIGERGEKLSGGQRQRISIARAILKDPPILILDEATSSVDNETEAAIQRSLERISVGRTTLVIAHRLSTVRSADRIHVMEGGRIVESGTHDELVDAHGLYAALWRVQTGESALAVDAAQ
jgi:ATP-binding cassette subfamily B protein